MIIEIDEKEISFGNQKLVYDLYHLDFPHYEKYRAPTVGGVFKNIVFEWVKALDSPTLDQPLFLPYAFDDEWVDCLKALEQCDKVIFKLVRIDENGWAVNFSDLNEFITSPHKICQESAEIFGEYNKDEILAALLNARVID